MGSQGAASEGPDREPNSATDEDDIPLEAGASVDGRYRISSVLGMGGVGVVYEAEHLGLKRAVALKVLRKSFVEHVSLRPRFEREARALSAMAHPNIVAVMDYAIADEGPYLVMELLAGRTLRALMDEGPVQAPYALRITRALLRGLGYAHGRGLVHRDIKPGNVFLQSLDAQGEYVKLLDFGFAKISPGSDLTTGSMISSVDETFGTPAYMSPEQAMGDDLDHRADLYSVGILLYEMLAGAKPFDGEVGEIINAHLTAPVPALEEFRSDVRATPELVALFERALAKDPAHRFDSADAMAAAIEDLPSTSLVPRDSRQAALGARETPMIPAPPKVSRARQDDVPETSNERARPWAFIAVAVAIGLAGIGLLWDAAERPRESTQENAEENAEESAQRLEAAQFPPTAVLVPTTAPAPAAAPLPQGLVAPEPRPAPWDMHPQVPLLESARAILDEGEVPGSEVINRLRAYSRGNRADPRPHLLLGRLFLAREWWSDALARLSIAYAVDPRFGADPDLRGGLEALALRPELSTEAEALLAHIDTAADRELPAPEL